MSAVVFINIRTLSRYFGDIYPSRSLLCDLAAAESNDKSGKKMPRPQQRARLTEGVFVTSKKRMYNEYIFDLRNDENSKIRNRRPGRRGPLNESTRQSIEDVKLEGGACWRCKMLKKPVS